MNIKKRIRKAIESQKPNILGSILQDCPERSTAKKKPRLSDRTVDFISSGISFVLILSTALGIFLYCRDMLPDSIIHTSDPSSTLNQSQNTSSVPTATPSTPSDTISLEDMIAMDCAIVSPSPVQEMDVNYSCRDGTDGILYDIEIAYLGYLYSFSHSEIGTLISIDVLQLDSCQDGTFITPTAAEQIGLLMAQSRIDLSLYDIEMVANVLCTVLDPIYLQNILCSSKYTQAASTISFYIDPCNGEVIYEHISNHQLSPKDARDTVLAYIGIDAFSEVKHLHIETQRGWYHVVLEHDAFLYEMDIDYWSGVISNFSSTKAGLRADENPNAGNIGISHAKKVAFRHANIPEDEVYSFSYSYEEGEENLYHLTFYYDYMGHRKCQYTINAKTGEIVHFRFPDTGDPYLITALEARDIALEHTNVSIESLRNISVGIWAEGSKFDFEVPDNDLYGVSFSTSTQHYHATIDTVTGQILNCSQSQASPSRDETLPDVVGWAYALDVALKQEGITLDLVYYFNYSYLSGNVYEIRFKYGFFGMNSHYCNYRVDAYTGEILIDYVDPEDHLPDGGVGNGFATEVALKHVGLLASEVSNIRWEYAKNVYGSNCYIIRFEYGYCTYEVYVRYALGSVLRYNICMTEENSQKLRDMSLAYLGWDSKDVHYIDITCINDCPYIVIVLGCGKDYVRLDYNADGTIRGKQYNSWTDYHDAEGDGLIGRSAARDIALAHMGAQWDDLTSLYIQYYNTLRLSYSVQITVNGTPHFLIIDAMTGAILHSSYDPSISKILSEEEALAIVMKEENFSEETISNILNNTPSEILCRLVNDHLSEKYLCYLITFDIDDVEQAYLVSIFDGTILSHSTSNFN